jgi:lycopene cyclase domain-containing protein
MSLYLWVILSAFIGPLALSFDKKVHFYTYWKSIFLGIIIVASVFIAGDELFTQWKVWGFNPDYVLGIYLGNLPLEEVLFFIIVPYNCLFIHEVQKAYFPNLKLDILSTYFLPIFGLICLLLIFFNWGNYYTVTYCSTSLLLSIGFFFNKSSWFARFVLTYLISIIPFLIVNGILTGMFTPEPIVWYNEAHIIGLRIFTIPVEDLFYNFSMLLPVIWVHESLVKKQFVRK